MKYRFDELLEFPCIVDFRIIVDAEKDGALNEITNYINSLYADSVQKITAPPKISSNGTYISHNVPVMVPDARALEMLYEKLSMLDYIRHIT